MRAPTFNFNAFFIVHFCSITLTIYASLSYSNYLSQLGIPGLLHVLGSKPLRLEYLLRIRAKSPENVRSGLGPRSRGLVSLRTGIDRVDVSLDELNFCLEWDESSPLWVSQ